MSPNNMNLVPSEQGKIFDSVTASAILRPLSLNGKFINFEGTSYRSKKYRNRDIAGVVDKVRSLLPYP